MLKDSKTMREDKKVDITKMTTIENTQLDQSLNADSSRLVPLMRGDFNQAIIENWCEIRAKKQPKRRSFHTAFIYKDHFYIYGGIDIAAGKLNDLKHVNLNAEVPIWEDVKTIGVTLEPLAYHAGCLYNSTYYIIGGQNVRMQAVNTVYIFDIENNKIEKISSKEADFIPLENHSANLYNKNIIIFGGFSHGHHRNEIFSFDTEAKTFSKLSVNEDAPGGRVNHGALIYNDHLYIFGGEGKDGVFFNDMWSFDLKNHHWKQISYNHDDIPDARSGHSFILINNEFYIFGGKSGFMNEKNDLWKFDPVKLTFTLIQDTMIEKYTEKELQEYMPNVEDDSKKVKQFKLLTKKDIPALNPLTKISKNKEKKIKKMEMMRKSQQLFEFRQSLEKELLRSPSINLMKRSIIYNLDMDINTAISRLNTMMQVTDSEKRKKILIPGNPPLPRDGHSAILYKNTIVIFGGDRNKFPFNDLFTFTI